MNDKDIKTINETKERDKRLEAFLRRRSGYRVPKQAVKFPYSELKRANNKR